MITYHDYSTLDGVTANLARLRELAVGRPLACTEYMARTVGSTFDPVLGYLRAHGVWALNWGFVRGRSQTVFPWDSWKTPYPAEPVLWHHDVLHVDGVPYSSANRST